MKNLTDKLLLAYLVRNSKDQVFYGETKEIESDLALNRRTIFRSFERLEKSGFIQRNTNSLGHYGKQRTITILKNE